MNCGCPVQKEDSNLRKLTIIRPKKIYGAMHTISIYIDDIEYGIFKNGDKKIFEIPNGNICVQAKIHGQKFDKYAGIDMGKSDVYHIKENDKNIYLLLKLKLNGMIAITILEKIDKENINSYLN